MLQGINAGAFPFDKPTGVTDTVTVNINYQVTCRPLANGAAVSGDMICSSATLHKFYVFSGTQINDTGFINALEDDVAVENHVSGVGGWVTPITINRNFAMVIHTEQWLKAMVLYGLPGFPNGVVYWQFYERLAVATPYAPVGTILEDLAYVGGAVNQYLPTFRIRLSANAGGYHGPDSSSASVSVTSVTCTGSTRNLMSYPPPAVSSYNYQDSYGYPTGHEWTHIDASASITGVSITSNAETGGPNGWEIGSDFSTDPARSEFSFAFNGQLSIDLFDFDALYTGPDTNFNVFAENIGLSAGALGDWNSPNPTVVKSSGGNISKSFEQAWCHFEVGGDYTYTSTTDSHGIITVTQIGDANKKKTGYHYSFQPIYVQNLGTKSGIYLGPEFPFLSLKHVASRVVEDGTHASLWSSGIIDPNYPHNMTVTQQAGSIQFAATGGTAMSRRQWGSITTITSEVYPAIEPIPVVSSAGFNVGDSVYIGGNNPEYAVVKSIPDGTHIELTANHLHHYTKDVVMNNSVFLRVFAWRFMDISLASIGSANQRVTIRDPQAGMEWDLITDVAGNFVTRRLDSMAPTRLIVYEPGGSLSRVQQWSDNDTGAYLPTLANGPHLGGFNKFGDTPLYDGLMVILGAMAVIAVAVAAGATIISLQTNTALINGENVTLLSSTGTSLGPPSGFHVSNITAGGSLAASHTYYYKLTALDAHGETTATVEINGTTTTVNKTIAIAWLALTGAISYNIYRSDSSGAETLLGTIGGGLTSFSDSGASGPNGITYPPTTDTTGKTSEAAIVSQVAEGPHFLLSSAVANAHLAGDDVMVGGIVVTTLRKDVAVGATLLPVWDSGGVVVGANVTVGSDTKVIGAALIGTNIIMSAPLVNAYAAGSVVNSSSALTIQIASMTMVTRDTVDKVLYTASGLSPIGNVGLSITEQDIVFAYVDNRVALDMSYLGDHIANTTIAEGPYSTGPNYFSPGATNLPVFNITNIVPGMALSVGDKRLAMAANNNGITDPFGTELLYVDHVVAGTTNYIYFTTPTTLGHFSYEPVFNYILAEVIRELTSDGVWTVTQDVAAPGSLWDSLCPIDWIGGGIGKTKLSGGNYNNWLLQPDPNGGSGISLKAQAVGQVVLTYPGCPSPIGVIGETCVLNGVARFSEAVSGHVSANGVMVQSAKVGAQEYDKFKAYPMTKQVTVLTDTDGFYRMKLNTSVDPGTGILVPRFATHTVLLADPQGRPPKSAMTVDDEIAPNIGNFMYQDTPTLSGLSYDIGQANRHVRAFLKAVTQVNADNTTGQVTTIWTGYGTSYKAADWTDTDTKIQGNRPCLRVDRLHPHQQWCMLYEDATNGLVLVTSVDEGKTWTPMMVISSAGVDGKHVCCQDGRIFVFWRIAGPGSGDNGAIHCAIYDRKFNVMVADTTVISSGVDAQRISADEFVGGDGKWYMSLLYYSSGTLTLKTSSDGSTYN